MIRATGISKRFGDLEVLKSVSIEVAPNEIVSIMGPSGAGKTTLLQIIGTLDVPNSGRVEINKTSVLDLPNNKKAEFRNREIGFVFQFHQLLPEFSALENVMMPGLIGGRNFKECEIEAQKLLDYLNLRDRSSHKPSELSGGEKQRVAVARALINRPSVILADEPSGSLDSKNRAELHELFQDLRSRFNQTILIVTHDEELAMMSDRIIRMRDGKIEI